MDGEATAATQTSQSDPALAPSGKNGLNSRPFFAPRVRLLNGWEVEGKQLTLDRIADAQNGRIATRQLMALGWTRQMIRTRHRHGALRWCRRGVWAIGQNRDTRDTRDTEVLLALGPGAGLAGVSVLAHHGLIPAPAEVHVVAPRSKSRPGIRVHRFTHPPRIICCDGLPMTTVERAIADAAHHFGGHDALAQIIHEALYRTLTSRTKLADTHHPRIQAILAGPSQRTESQHQQRALALLRQANLPEEIETEVEILGFRVDIYLRRSRVAIEVDPFRTHGQIEKNFERDKRKDQTFRQHGIETIRVTGTQLKTAPYAFVADVSAAIARRLTDSAPRSAAARSA